MLHAVIPVASQMIKPDAVFLWLDYRKEFLFQPDELFVIDPTLEDTVLHALAKVQTSLCDVSQSFLARPIDS
jgi:hypothetical protein